MTAASKLLLKSFQILMLLNVSIFIMSRRKAIKKMVLANSKVVDNVIITDLRGAETYTAATDLWIYSLSLRQISAAGLYPVLRDRAAAVRSATACSTVLHLLMSAALCLNTVVAATKLSAHVSFK